MHAIIFLLHLIDLIKFFYLFWKYSVFFFNYLLYTWYVNNNALKKCKKMFDTVKKQKSFFLNKINNVCRYEKNNLNEIKFNFCHIQSS